MSRKSVGVGRSIGVTLLIGLLAACGGGSGTGTSVSSLKSVEVTPANTQFAAGMALQMSATAIYSDGTFADVSTQVTWASSNAAVTSVSNTSSNQGLATAVAPGGATVSAAFKGVSGSTSVTVTAAELLSIEVTPVTPTVANGTSLQLTATGIFSDHSTQDLTRQVSWASSSTTVATVSNATGSNGLINTAAVGTATISATLGSVAGSTGLTVSTAVLTSIEVTPASPSAAKGTQEQLRATGIFSDNSRQDLTTQVTWSSTDGSVAVVSNASGRQGLVSNAGVGSATVLAALDGVSASASVTVTAATLVSIQVTPVNPSVANGLTQQMIATGIYSDNSTQVITTQVVWSSSNASAATVSNAAGSQGLVSSAAPGNTTLTATSGSFSGSTALTVTAAALVSIQVTPADAKLADGLTEQLTATGTFSDNSTQDLTTQVTWSSAEAAVVVVSNAVGSQGLVTAVGSGTVILTASKGDVSGTTSVADSNGWTWVGGSSAVDPAGIYGTLKTAAAGDAPGGRANAATWTGTGGNLWLFGGQGYDLLGNFDFLNDLWMYSPTTRLWTWEGGSSFISAPGVYGTGGMPGARSSGLAWTDAAGHFWLFGGVGSDVTGVVGLLSDLWMYNPDTGVWLWVSGPNTSGVQGTYPAQPGVAQAGSVPGARYQAVSWVDSSGRLWLFGGFGFDSTGAQGYLNDLWMFDPSSGLWTWVGGSNSVQGTESVYGTQGTANVANVPGGRTFPVGWVDLAGNFWLFGGYGIEGNGATGALNDLWMYNPAAHEWTWVGGSNTANGPGSYGAKDTPAASNLPGARYQATAWTDKAGNFWLLGGIGGTAGPGGTLDDLWTYNLTTGLWTWVSGSNTGNVSGSYGSGVGNGVPGSRESAAAWRDNAGNLWMFGGSGYDGTGNPGFLGDLWEY